MENIITKKLPEVAYMSDKLAQGHQKYMTPYGKRLVAMGLAFLPQDFSNTVASFSVRDFFYSLNIADGTNSRKLLLNASLEVLDCKFMRYETNGNISGINWLKSIHIIRKCQLYDTKPEELTKELVSQINYLENDWIFILSFNEELEQELIRTKGFCGAFLEKLGNLNSFYTMRLYEEVLSTSGFSGKEGNKPGSWFFQKTPDEARTFFDVVEKYGAEKNLTRFIKNTVDSFNSEINTDIDDKKTGLLVTTDLIKIGRTTQAYKFEATDNYEKIKSQLVKNNDIIREKYITNKKNKEKWEQAKKTAEEKIAPEKYLTGEFKDKKILTEAYAIIDEIMVEENKAKKLKKVTSRKKSLLSKISQSQDITTPEIVVSVIPTTIEIQPSALPQNYSVSITDKVTKIVNKLKRVENKSDAFKDIMLKDIREKELSEALALNIEPDDLLDLVATALKEAPEEMKNLVQKLISETPIGDYASLAELGKDFKKTAKTVKPTKVLKVIAVNALFICVGLILFLAGTDVNLSTIFATPSLLLLLLI